MSGHSKWATTKHRKAAVDAKKGRIFTRLGKEITVAARMGGGDPESNPRLRLAVGKAREANMPLDNIKRAIQKGTGELPGVVYEEILYEGYGPGGVALLIEVATDNRNRTVGELRHRLTKYGGKMGETGCVGWMFHKKGFITVDAAGVSEDALIEAALAAGADDVRKDEDAFEVVTDPGAFEAVRDAIQAGGIPVASAEVRMEPETAVKLDGKDAERMLKLMEMIEDQDDVQAVSANFDIPDEIMEQALA
jgi:YebC/PmpR family DNA-binding regulatory protein